MTRLVLAVLAVACLAVAFWAVLHGGSRPQDQPVVHPVRSDPVDAHAQPALDLSRPDPLGPWVGPAVLTAEEAKTFAELADQLRAMTTEETS